MPSLLRLLVLMPSSCGYFERYLATQTATAPSNEPKCAKARTASNMSLRDERHLAGDSGRLGILAGFFDPLRIDIDADAARAVSQRRGDRDPAVAAAEIVGVRVRYPGQLRGV